jgi:hypothetical protein
MGKLAEQRVKSQSRGKRQGRRIRKQSYMQADQREAVRTKRNAGRADKERVIRF